ncbi:UDP-N-acetylmuramoyl-L-alanine--D-glutamate ligase [Dehalobacterium formicoaceticum]|uniref:UDP-N-acetylmuramoylalanine--D-glutamate ligase n=1 Tax=Dehalobacterium formicoaceticum TaxID=51515 RepID=A0ABT1Y1P8_9FIRM|nr:UDP-N-acetylmuramoyl-L-alanine--D-glutamate ligase [Dehalobacterium formicoaceticum]MCR6544478.1 UDP-N-acetylmuramoyl-L-alanine--D-glutamate ligase [Dehalobacterium formicoaceticum]
MWEKNVNNKKILVLGGGISGCAVAGFLSDKGARVTLTDSKSRDDLENALTQLLNKPMEYILGAEPEIKPGSFDYSVISPGIPLDTPLVKKLNQAGIPVTGEMELAYQYSKSPFVAITGTNGKTTTTSLLGQIFADAGRPVFVGGNIGIPMVTKVESLSAETILVAEVSSFQLETIESFRPKVAVILNITPDHLDRHKTMEEYTKAKSRIFENQEANDCTVLNYDDLRVRELGQSTPGQVLFFSQETELAQGIFVKNGIMTIKTGADTMHVIDIDHIYIKGKHNLENALAAAGAAFCLGVSPESIAHTLKNFPGVAHRLEFVKESAGVTYINDSKGTNPDSTIKALEAFDQPIILIAGGKNKGSDFTKLAALIREKARALILVGEAAPDMEQAVRAEGFHNIYPVNNFFETVSLAQKMAQPGDIVLLSPACASWDMFKNFEERGDLFKKLVHELP